MRILNFTASDGITHNFSPKFIVDAYKTPYPDRAEWCVIIKFCKDACIPGNICTKVYKTEEECDNALAIINAARES